MPRHRIRHAVEPGRGCPVTIIESEPACAAFRRQRAIHVDMSPLHVKYSNAMRRMLLGEPSWRQPFAVLSLTATPALANPHVWVETPNHVRARRPPGRRALGSSGGSTISTVPTPSGPTISTATVRWGPKEVRALRTEEFDPLARFDHYVHVWVGDASRDGHEVEPLLGAGRGQAARATNSPVPVTPPADPGRRSRRRQRVRPQERGGLPVRRVRSSCSPTAR